LALETLVELAIRACHRSARSVQNLKRA